MSITRSSAGSVSLASAAALPVRSQSCPCPQSAPVAAIRLPIPAARSAVTSACLYAARATGACHSARSSARARRPRHGARNRPARARRGSMPSPGRRRRPRGHRRAVRGTACRGGRSCRWTGPHAGPPSRGPGRVRRTGRRARAAAAARRMAGEWQAQEVRADAARPVGRGEPVRRDVVMRSGDRRPTRTRRRSVPRRGEGRSRDRAQAIPPAIAVRRVGAMRAPRLMPVPPRRPRSAATAWTYPERSIHPAVNRKNRAMRKQAIRSTSRRGGRRVIRRSSVVHETRSRPSARIPAR